MRSLSLLGKDKPAMKQVENNTQTFLKTLQNVEGNLSKHIIYLSQVSTVQPHEGSSYAAQKVSRFGNSEISDSRPESSVGSIREGSLPRISRTQDC